MSETMLRIETKDDEKVYYMIKDGVTTILSHKQYYAKIK